MLASGCEVVRTRVRGAALGPLALCMVIGAILLSPCTPRALADADSSSLLGKRVRVSFEHSPHSLKQGILKSGGAAEITLAPLDLHPPYAIFGVDSIARCQVHAGQRRNTVRGALIGAGALALGATILVAAHGDGGEDWDEYVYAVFVSALAGAVWGAAFGYFHKSDRWEDVPVSRLRLGLSPRGAPGVRLSWRF